MTALRHINVEISFYPLADGGRSLPVNLNGGKYRPHFRVNGGEFLGVAFVDGPHEPVAAGWTGPAVVALVYEPNVDYSMLTPGVAFDVMEGDRVVAKGNVRNHRKNDGP